MIYHRLGKSGLRVSKTSLGLDRSDREGCAHKSDPQDIVELVRNAFDQGVNLFFEPGPDLNGDRDNPADALCELPSGQYHVCTRLAVSIDPAGYELISSDSLHTGIDRLLQHLRRDELDILFVELWPTVETYERFRDELYPELQKARFDGKIRYIGGVELGQYDGSHSWLARGLRDDLFDVVMVAYNMINQSAEREVFRLCRRNLTGVIGVYAVRRVFSRSKRLRETIRALKAGTVIDPNAVDDEKLLDWLLDDETDSLVAAAYKFAAGHPDIHSVMSGTRETSHLEENIRAVLGTPLPKAHRQRLCEIFGELAMPIGN